MFIQAFPSGPLSTNAYLLACSHTRQAVIIDPAPESFAEITTIIENEDFKPIAVLLTHSHWDHIGDVKAFKTKYKIPVAIHPTDAPNLEHPGADQLPCWLDIPGVIPDKLLKEGDIIDVGDLHLTIIETPGHSAGSICFYSADQQLLISGDTLFKGSIGNISFPTSRPDLMWSSLDKLAKLPPTTQVFPGHGPSTTIGNESWLKRAKEQFGN